MRFQLQLVSQFRFQPRLHFSFNFNFNIGCAFWVLFDFAFDLGIRQQSHGPLLGFRLFMVFLVYGFYVGVNLWVWDLRFRVWGFRAETSLAKSASFSLSFSRGFVGPLQLPLVQLPAMAAYSSQILDSACLRAA